LQVKTPTGALVVAGGAGVQAGRDRTWDFARIKLPQGAPVAGQWSAQIIRPHRIYVNGFTPDSFAAPAAGISLVRDEIHRLCPDGCRRVISFELGRLGKVSAYAGAVAAEAAAGLLSGVKTMTDPNELAAALAKERWDLIVYAYMGPDKDQPYDQRLSSLVCENQRAILTDVRAEHGGPVILRCGGALRDGSTNWPLFAGDGKLVGGPLELRDPGHPVFSYGLRPTSSQSLVQAATPGGKNPAVTAIVSTGKDARWYLDVLGAGLARIELHNRSLDQRASTPSTRGSRSNTPRSASGPSSPAPRASRAASTASCSTRAWRRRRSLRSRPARRCSRSSTTPPMATCCPATPTGPPP
jgi:hypothetical protein